MLVRILVMVSDTHAHVLNDVMSSGTIGAARKNLETTKKYLPYLQCFKDGRWWVEEHKVRQALDTPNFYCARRNLIDNLRKQGYKVV